MHCIVHCVQRRLHRVGCHPRHDLCLSTDFVLHGKDKSVCQVGILFPVHISLSHVLRLFTSGVRVQVSHLTEVCWELPLCLRESEDCYHHYPHQLMGPFGLPCHTLPCVLQKLSEKFLDVSWPYIWLHRIMDKLLLVFTKVTEMNTILFQETNVHISIILNGHSFTGTDL